MSHVSEMRLCRKCGLKKEAASFYRRNVCPDCCQREAKDRRDSSIEEYRARDRGRYRDSLVRRLNARECSRRAREDGRHTAYTKKWREQNPEKYRAHVALNNAVRDGKVQRGVCVRCGSPEVHAHHEDYSRPLDVVWLCPAHHGHTWRVDG